MPILNFVCFIFIVQSFWNLLDLLLMLLAFTAVISQVKQNVIGDNLLLTVSKDQFRKNVNISLFIWWEKFLSMLLSFISFFVIIRVLRIFSINRMIPKVIKMLSILKNDIISFAIVYMVLLFAFSTTFTLFYEASLNQFNTIGSSLMNLFNYAGIRGTSMNHYYESFMKF